MTFPVRWHACPRLAFTFALFATAALSGAACRVDRAEFEKRVFSCDIAAPNPGCGTDDTGKKMDCFDAQQIGATGFCAKTCDAPMSTPDGPVCLASGIELRSCHPSADFAVPNSACDQPGLACYRTDLLKDEGVCTTLNPCTEDIDCRDPVRSTCATSFLKTTIYPQAGDALKLDHMFCLQTGCRAGRTACSPGSTCLQDVIPAEAHPADICVPNCDSHYQCPPNFLCYKKASTDVAPGVCIPGLLGFVCESAIDCMIGTCRDTFIGYNVCSTQCDGDADCRKFDGQQGNFSCIKNPADLDTPGWCQTPDAYRGSICRTTEDCMRRNTEEICTRAKAGDETGVCLLPCKGGTTCLPRSGIGHTCVPPTDDGPNICVPGYFGYPCADQTNCVGNAAAPDSLLCSPVSMDPQVPKICTIPCASDADCGKPSADGTGNRWVAGSGFCGSYLHLDICLPYASLDEGTPCQVGAACKSGKCSMGVCEAVAQ